MISPNMEKHKQSNRQESNSLNTAREFIKIAKSYAYFKKTEGYREDDYTLFEIINQDACLDICSRGPADYYYEKAYEILCEELGPNHRDTLQLMDEIVNYHINNLKRMMLERFVFSSILMFPFVYMITQDYFDSWNELISFYVIYGFIYLYWQIELILLCFMEKRCYQSYYKKGMTTGEFDSSHHVLVV